MRHKPTQWMIFLSGLSLIFLPLAFYFALFLPFFGFTLFSLPFSTWSYKWIGFCHQARFGLFLSIQKEKKKLCISVYAFSLLYLYGKYDERFKWLPKGIWILLGDCYVLFCDKHSCNRIVFVMVRNSSQFWIHCFKTIYLRTFFSPDFFLCTAKSMKTIIYLFIYLFVQRCQLLAE